MHPFRRRAECGSICLCGLTVVVALLIYFGLHTSQIYTHLFYIPIVWIATRLPRYTLHAGIGFALLHLVLEWARNTEMGPYVLARAGIIVLVSLLLRRVWLKEQQAAAQIRQLDFQRFHDALTGTFNRQFYDEYVRAPLNYPVALFYCDINKLKTINDTFGHDAGDRQIRATANLLHQCIRAEDHLIRMGGDEFLILAQRCGSQEATRLHQRVLEMLKHERLAWKKKMAHPVEQGSMDYPGNAATPEAPVDFSIGFALAQHPEELETAMQAADRAMYEHKQSREA